MRRWLCFGSVAAIAFGADQLTKLWARGNLRPNESVPVIEGFFDWRLSFNHGSAFSMFEGWSGATVMLSVMALACLAAIAWMVWKTDPDRRYKIAALGLIGGGAVGNLMDRVVQGKVTDFVSWHYHDAYWPIFNLADAFLLVGVGIMIADELASSRDLGAEA